MTFPGSPAETQAGRRPGRPPTGGWTWVLAWSAWPNSRHMWMTNPSPRRRRAEWAQCAPHLSLGFPGAPQPVPGVPDKGMGQGTAPPVTAQGASLPHIPTSPMGDPGPSFFLGPLYTLWKTSAGCRNLFTVSTHCSRDRHGGGTVIPRKRQHFLLLPTCFQLVLPRLLWTQSSSLGPADASTEPGPALPEGDWEEKQRLRGSPAGEPGSGQTGRGCQWVGGWVGVSWEGQGPETER